MKWTDIKRCAIGERKADHKMAGAPRRNYPTRIGFGAPMSFAGINIGSMHADVVNVSTYSVGERVVKTEASASGPGFFMRSVTTAADTDSDISDNDSIEDVPARRAATPLPNGQIRTVLQDFGSAGRIVSYTGPPTAAAAAPGSDPAPPPPPATPARAVPRKPRQPPDAYFSAPMPPITQRDRERERAKN